MRLTWLTRNPLRGRQAVADDLDLVVLGGHLDEAEFEVLDRMVRAVMPEPEAPRVGAGRATHDLVAEADAQERPAVVDDRAGERDLGFEAGRVAGAGRQDHAIDVAREDVGRGDRVREDPDRRRRGGASPARCSS